MGLYHRGLSRCQSGTYIGKGDGADKGCGKGKSDRTGETRRHGKGGSPKDCRRCRSARYKDGLARLLAHIICYPLSECPLQDLGDEGCGGKGACDDGGLGLRKDQFGGKRGGEGCGGGGLDDAGDGA